MKRNFTFSHFKLILSAVLLMAFSAANATYVPVVIPVTGPNGFNADVVADSAPPVQQPPYLPGQNWATMRTTATFDASTYYLVATGFKRDTFTSNPFVMPALPTNRVLTSNTVTSPTQLFWNLAPYNGNNSIRMTAANSSTVINVNPATLIGDVYILGASTGGATTVNVTVTFVGGTTQVLNSQTYQDWMNGNPYEVLAIGRVIKSTALGDQTLAGINPRLYMVKVAITNANFSKQIQSITITKVTGTSTVLNIMAITIDDQSTCLPVVNNPTLQPSSIGLREARFIITPPVSSAPGFTTPQNYQVVATKNATPPSPVVGGTTFTLSGTTPTDTVKVTGLQSASTYYFHVRTDCGGGNYSMWRSSAAFTTLTCGLTSANVNPAPNMTQATVNVTAPAQAGTVLSDMTNATYGYQWIFDTNPGDPVVPPGSPTQVPGTPLPIPSVGPWTPFPTTANPHPLSGLNAGTVYYFHHRKTCVGDTANSKWTNTTFTTLPCPNTLMAPTITNITTVSAVIKWNLPSVSSNPSVGYDYAVTTSATPPGPSGPGWTTLNLPIPNPPGPFTAPLAFRDTVKNLIPQTQYWLHVRNRCSGGFNSAPLTIAFPQTQNCPNATSVPTIVSNVPGAMTFKWNGTSIPGHYEWHYALQIASAGAPVTWVSTFDTFAILPNATYPVYPGVAYKLWVRGNCTITNAPWLSSVTVTNPFPPCLAPIGMGITNVNMHGAAITWTNGFNGIDYQYAVTTSPTPPANGITTPDTFHNATQLTSNTKYYVHVRTHCNTTPIGPLLFNYSPWIKDSFITTSTCLPPVPPTISNVTSSSAQIMWNFFPGLYGYEFLLNKDPNTPTVSGLPINYNGYYPINLSSGTTYYLHLRTRCDTLTYSPWILVSFTTDKVCPATPPVSANTGIWDTKANFSWTAIPGVTKYEYAITKTATPPSVSTGQFTTATFYNAINLDPNSNYWFHLQAFCSDQDSTGWSSLPFKTFPLAVGNLNGNKDFNLEVFPNPATDVLNITITGRRGASARMQLVDMSGKVVETVTVDKDKSEINISKMAAGMYLLKYVDSENAGVIRVEKQ